MILVFFSSLSDFCASVTRYQFFPSAFGCPAPTRTSTEQPTVQDGFPSTWLWHRRCTREDFPTPAKAHRGQCRSTGIPHDKGTDGDRDNQPRSGG